LLKSAVERSIAIKVIRENNFMQKDKRNYRGKFNFIREGNFGKVEKEKKENSQKKKFQNIRLKRNRDVECCVTSEC